MGAPLVPLKEIAEHASKLTGVFGRWPPFHDAEVLRLRLDRAGDDGPTLQLDLHLFEMTAEVDERGYFVTRHHTEATLEFRGIRLHGCEGFNHQNVIDSPICERLDPRVEDGLRYRVTVPAQFGVDLALDCKGVRVVAARPFRVP